MYMYVCLYAIALNSYLIWSKTPKQCDLYQDVQLTVCMSSLVRMYMHVVTKHLMML